MVLLGTVGIILAMIGGAILIPEITFAGVFGWVLIMGGFGVLKTTFQLSDEWKKDKEDESPDS